MRSTRMKRNHNVSSQLQAELIFTYLNLQGGLTNLRTQAGYLDIEDLQDHYKGVFPLFLKRPLEGGQDALFHFWEARITSISGGWCHLLIIQASLKTLLHSILEWYSCIKGLWAKVYRVMWRFPSQEESAAAHLRTFSAAWHQGSFIFFPNISLGINTHYLNPKTW